MEYDVTVLPGDGIGPEVTAQATAAVDALAEAGGFSVRWQEAVVGGAALDRYGEPLPDAVLEQCKSSHAVLLGAVGGPQWDNVPGDKRPERGLLKLRKELGVFANLRPVKVEDALVEASPLRPERVRGTDLLVVRELTGGIYFGTPSERSDDEALSTMRYSRTEIERIARIAFDQARKRRGKVTSVDKANVLEVSRLWRAVVSELHQAEFSDVELEHMYVDNAAMQLVLRPSQFDVILTGNLFGDILSDASATLVGSLGVLPSASLGGPVALFEPVHGSAPDLAGQHRANPVAAILSAAFMLQELGELDAANALRRGVSDALTEGHVTADLASPGQTPATTRELGALIRHKAVPHLSTSSLV